MVVSIVLNQSYVDYTSSYYTPSLITPHFWVPSSYPLGTHFIELDLDLVGSPLLPITSGGKVASNVMQILELMSRYAIHRVNPACFPTNTYT